MVGVTGAGKGSVIWSTVRAMLPALAGGTAQVWAIDPKRMELAYGRDLFAHYADSGESAVALLEKAVASMQERAERYAGKQRSHVPTTDDPFVVVLLDEVAFLTAYHPDRDVRRRAENAIATLTSQGRSVGFAVLAALQDPRKEVMNLRNLFPDKVALRLDEASQVDMVLGEGARERGAEAHLIDPTLPGWPTSAWKAPRPRCGYGPPTSRTRTSPLWRTAKAWVLLLRGKRPDERVLCAGIASKKPKRTEPRSRCPTTPGPLSHPRRSATPSR